MQLRPYQERFVSRAIIGFERPDNGRGPFRKQMGVMGTGGGKTVCFSFLAWYAQRYWKNGPVLILVDQDVLVEQTMATLFKAAGIFGEVLQADRTPTANATVIVATMQTMSNRLDKYAPDHFGFIVVDECDRAVSPEWQAVLNHFDKHAMVCGVTATPDRTDKLDVLNYFEHVFDDVPMFELIRLGFLVPVKVRTIPIKIDLNEVKKTKGDFGAKALAKAIVPYFEAICAGIKEFAGDRKNLVFHPLRETSREFVEIALNAGINAAHIDGESKDKKQLRQRFRDSEITMMSNAILLNRGFDEPSIDCVTILRPTDSPSFYQQMVGRGTRLWCPHGCNKYCEHGDAKKDLLLLDFLWQYEKHGLQRPASLIAANERVAAALTKKFTQSKLALDLQETNDEVSAAVEAAIIEEIKRHAGDTGRFFDAMEVAQEIGSIELQDYVAVEEWERRPVTASQAEALQQIGVDVRSVQNYGHAEMILRIAANRDAQGLCTLKQMRYLEYFGYQKVATRTKKEAGTLINIAKSRGYGRGGKKIHGTPVVKQGFEAMKAAVQSAFNLDGK